MTVWRGYVSVSFQEIVFNNAVTGHVFVLVLSDAPMKTQLKAMCCCKVVGG